VIEDRHAAAPSFGRALARRHGRTSLLRHSRTRGSRRCPGRPCPH
jgi:hypothetical protein